MGAGDWELGVLGPETRDRFGDSVGYTVLCLRLFLAEEEERASLERASSLSLLPFFPLSFSTFDGVGRASRGKATLLCLPWREL